MTRKQSGFTLTELAVVLFIIALLLGGMLLPLTAQMDQKNNSETRRTLGEAKEALIGYAMTHTATDGKPYLPCPDTDNDGLENRDIATLACTSTEGNLPWSDLGTGALDAWSNRLRYRVAPNFSNKATGFALGTAASIRVCGSAGCPGTVPTVATALPAIILSHGPNGFGAVNQSGATNAASTDADELENLDANNDFVMHTPVQNGFDDLLVWVPATVLFNRMISAGKLP